MPQVSLAKRSVNLNVTGSGHRPVTFIHGVGPGAVAWDLVVQGLPESWRALALDLPGFGESEAAGFSGAIAEAALVVHHTLHGYGQLSAGTLVGHGYGGLVALEFASRYPTHVDRLVLISSGAFVRDPQVLAGRHDDILGRGWDAEQAAAWLQVGLVEALAEPHLDAMRDAAAAVPGEIMAGCFAAMLRAALLEAARTLAVPLLLIRGDADPLVSADDLAIVAARVPDATVTQLPNVGHWPHLEAPDELRTELIAFIDAAVATGDAETG